MQNFSFLSVILVISSFHQIRSQELIVESLGSKSNDRPEDNIRKHYFSTDFTSEIAIFGWFKLLSFSSEARMIIQVSVQEQNEEDINYINLFPLRLMAQSEMIHFSTYRQIDGNQKDIEPVYVQFNSRMFVWGFFYFGHNPTKMVNFCYLKFPDLQNQYTIKNIIQPLHKSFYVSIGDIPPFEYFGGELSRPIFHYGKGAYRESSLRDLQSIHPEYNPGCCVLFRDCYFIQSLLFICENEDIQIQKPIEAKSVFIPKNQQLLIKGLVGDSKEVQTHIIETSISCAQTDIILPESLTFVYCTAKNNSSQPEG